MVNKTSMSELIDSVLKTRKLAAEIAGESLWDIENTSEIEIHKLIISKMSTHGSIFPTGWYDPPQDGISVLFDEAPFERLLYDSLRNPKYLPSKTHKFSKEAVGSIYLSPVSKTTNTLADIGFTIYRGENEKIKQHFKKSYNVVLTIAQYTQEGMKFSELCKFASDLFIKNNLKPSKRTLMSSDQNQSLNLGHSIPGSLENEKITGTSFEEIKENIRTKRIHFIDTENFQIPKTFAFTVESRLEDASDSTMPSVSWHFIVCFDNGKKTILENCSEIFKVVGMDYMNLRHGVDVI